MIATSNPTTEETSRRRSSHARAASTGARSFTALLLSSALVLLATTAGGCAGRKRGEETSALTAEARYRLGIEYLEKHRYQKAINTLAGINQYESDNRQQLEPLVRLTMADATFYQGNDISLIDARSMYLDFVTLYGDHPLAPYAQFQAGICSLKQVIHPARDQTQTRLALQDLREVDLRYPGDRFATGARLMIRRGEYNLAEHEIIVGRFYMKRRKYVASIERFRKVLDLYPNLADKDRVYYYLGESLLRSENTEEGRIYLDKLVRDFPGGKYDKLARKSLSDAGLDLGLDLPGAP